MNKKIGMFLFLICFAPLVHSQDVHIIPAPASLKMLKGQFVLDKDCSFKLSPANDDLLRISGFFNDYLKEYYGFNLKNQGSGKQVSLTLDPGLDNGDEGYKLTVGPKGIAISAAKAAGIFYGIQTLEQLLPVTPGAGELPIAALDITDQPRFKWRGSMLDVCRHFFPVSFIKKYIDILAMYKINTFHWHLTDDQGWRIEIKKYPLLAEVSAWRDQTLVGHSGTSQQYDGIEYGGFYTQDQIRDVVKYAADRYITIVPEIEMPGHSSAALAAYPNLGCTGGPYQVQGSWGIFKDVYCAGKEETFQFLEDVLDEVMDLFPSEYIHIGGDECPKDAWKQCPLCQKRMKDNGLKDEQELQSYFVTRICNYLTSKGRRLIGWDEILEGGIAPQAAVMSWRGVSGGIDAVKQHHNVVMTPNDYMYFDHYQSRDTKNEPLAIGGFLPLQKVYSYEPVPEDFTPEEAKYILGVQANLWTEYIPNTQKVEYMLLPRLDALAEVAWSSAGNRNYENFTNRLVKEYGRLKMLNINFRDHRK